ncbi:penicillin acylase family protein [Pseudomonas aeruginosa]
MLWWSGSTGPKQRVPRPACGRPRGRPQAELARSALLTNVAPLDATTPAGAPTHGLASLHAFFPCCGAAAAFGTSWAWPVASPGSTISRRQPAADLRRATDHGPAQTYRSGATRWACHWIETGTFHDALFALGYVHASDRLSQMVSLRLLAQGRLAEMVGPGAGDRPLHACTVNLRQAGRGERLQERLAAPATLLRGLRARVNATRIAIATSCRWTPAQPGYRPE